MNIVNNNLILKIICNKYDKLYFLWTNYLQLHLNDNNRSYSKTDFVSEKLGNE